MSDDQNRPAENWDPLTSPYWESDENIDDFIAEKPVEIEVPEVQVSRTIPQPPDVDQILRGEYTGWVPLIKPGDSIETATIRFEADNARREIVESKTFEEMFESDPTESQTSPEPQTSNSVTAEDVSEIKELIREMKSEPDVYVKDFYPNFKDIAEDPDTVASPAQALEEARRRIEQMRANLQVNLSRVAQSFEHPIFEPTPVEPEARTWEPPQPIEEPKPVVFDYISVETPVQVEQVQAEEIFEEPKVQETISHTTVVAEESKKEDHSLELVIMRDEIKDLRDRLDSSQKLIETLMERLANLAELALTNRRD